MAGNADDTDGGADAARQVKLIMEIGAYIDQHNLQPKPFIWKAKAADTFEKVKRTAASWIIRNLLDALH